MKDFYLKTLGLRVKQLRKMKGMSMQELAEKAGYDSKSSIFRIENGQNDISHRKLVQLANALGVSVKELVDGIELTVEMEESSLTEKINKLDEVNRIRLQAYVDALLDSQEGQS